VYFFSNGGLCEETLGRDSREQKRAAVMLLFISFYLDIYATDIRVLSLIIRYMEVT